MIYNSFHNNLNGWHKKEKNAGSLIALSYHLGKYVDSSEHTPWEQHIQSLNIISNMICSGYGHLSGFIDCKNFETIRSQIQQIYPTNTVEIREWFDSPRISF